MKAKAVEVKVVGSQAWDPYRDNVDVEVRLDDGRRYAATFFTLENVAQLFAKNRKTGECRAGLYFWADKMIVVETLTTAVIESTVDDLLATGEFEGAFGLLDG